MLQVSSLTTSPSCCYYRHIWITVVAAMDVLLLKAENSAGIQPYRHFSQWPLALSPQNIPLWHKNAFSVDYNSERDLCKTVDLQMQTRLIFYSFSEF